MRRVLLVAILAALGLVIQSAPEAVAFDQTWIQGPCSTGGLWDDVPSARADGNESALLWSEGQGSVCMFYTSVPAISTTAFGTLTTSFSVSDGTGFMIEQGSGTTGCGLEPGGNVFAGFGPFYSSGSYIRGRQTLPRGWTLTEVCVTVFATTSDERASALLDDITLSGRTGVAWSESFSGS